MVLAIALAACASTFLGGLFALRLRDRLHLILGFSAGAVVGVAFFDLMPEALELGGMSHSITTITAVIAIGFAAYLILDRLFLLHVHDDHADAIDTQRGSLGALTLAIHSLLDGIGIGLAFKVSPEVGAIVAAAVLTHDFSDGINTVNMIIRFGGDRARAFRWLAIDAVAPIIGIVLTFFFSVTDSQLGLLLALFAGFFLFIGASDLLPETRHSHSVIWTTFTTVLGMLVIFGAVSFANI